MAYPHKWSPISYKSSAGQRKHIGQRPMLYRWTTPPTGGQHPPWEGAILKVYGHSAGICAKTAEPIDLPFGLWTRVGPRKHKFNRIRQTAPMFPHGRAHCRHLANANEPSVCCCYAALCQITLTTCYLRERLCGRGGSLLSAMAFLVFSKRQRRQLCGHVIIVGERSL